MGIINVLIVAKPITLLRTCSGRWLKTCVLCSAIFLTTIHPYAEPAAEAAEAAGAQGKFWEVHDYLYEHQSELGPEQLIVAGATLGLHTRRYTEELIRHVYAERIREDILSGVLSGITGTPTFFINGVRHDGSYDFDRLVGATNAHLKQRAA